MIFRSTVTIQRPQPIVWQILMNPDTWPEWWGGRISRIIRGWQENGFIEWAAGAPSRISHFVPEKQLGLVAQNSGTKMMFDLESVGDEEITVTYQEDYSSSHSAVSDRAAKQRQCDATVADLKRYAESPAGALAATVAVPEHYFVPAEPSPQAQRISTKQWWQFWR